MVGRVSIGLNDVTGPEGGGGFTHYIQNLEIYNAFIISEPEFMV